MRMITKSTTPVSPALLIQKKLEELNKKWQLRGFRNWKRV